MVFPPNFIFLFLQISQSLEQICIFSKDSIILGYNSEIGKIKWHKIVDHHFIFL